MSYIFSLCANINRFSATFLEKLSSHLTSLLENNIMRMNSVVASLTLIISLSAGVCFGDAVSDALNAKRDQVIAYIHQNKLAEADAAYQELITDFSTKTEIAAASYQIGDSYRAMGNFNKSKEVYKYVLNTWPGYEQTMLAKKGLAVSNIMLGNDSDADTAVSTLLSDYQDHEDLPYAIYDIADYL